MAKHVKSFDLVGKKEQVADYISMIDPTDTPFLSSIGSEKISNTYFQWFEDSLRAESKNTALEGADAQDTERDQPSTRGNGTQILTETFKVSGTSDAVKLYGRGKASAREMFKTGKLLKMDLELSLVGTGQTYVPAEPDVPGEFAGVQAQIADKVTSENGGTGRDLDENLVVEVQQAMYNEGSEASTLMIKPGDSLKVAGWSQASGRTESFDHGKTKITNKINVYESPFGTVRVTMNRRLRATDALIYNPKHWKLQTLRNWFTTKLAKTGDADRWQMLGEFSLKHGNQLATGLITDLN